MVVPPRAPNYEVTGDRELGTKKKGPDDAKKVVVKWGSQRRNIKRRLLNAFRIHI